MGLLSGIAFSTQAQVMFSEDFENGIPSTFVVRNNDGRPAAANLLATYGSNGWVNTQESATNKAASSTSWTNPVGTVDRWMITPQISITSANTKLFFKARAQDAQYPDGYQVYVRTVSSATDTNISGFTNMVLNVPAEATTWQNKNIDLAAFNGQNIRIAIRNNSNDKFVLHIDEMIVAALSPDNASLVNPNPMYLAAGNPTLRYRVTNSGSTNLTSFTLNYRVNNGTVQTTPVAGLNIASLSSGNVSSVLSNLTGGQKTIELWGTSVNGSSNTMDTITFSTYAASSNEMVQNYAVVEHFTQASCGPCASQNPAFHSFLNGQASKVIKISYHTSWPGVDSMNAHNPTDIATRVSFYGVSGVPNVNLSNAYSGSPAGASNVSLIDAEYAKPGLFDIAATTTYNAGTSTLTISGNWTSKIPFSRGNDLRLHLVLLEDPITYATAPGSNGETVFPSTVRKMFPNGGGTVLPTTITANQNGTFSHTFQVPAFYVFANLKLVALIQDATSRDILIARQFGVGNVSVENETLNNSLQVFPNPTTGNLNVSLDIEKSSDLIFKVVDIQGKVVYNERIENTLIGLNQNELQLGNLSNGVYFLQVLTDGAQLTRKIVINK